MEQENVEVETRRGVVSDTENSSKREDDDVEIEEIPDSSQEPAQVEESKQQQQQQQQQKPQRQQPVHEPSQSQQHHQQQQHQRRQSLTNSGTHNASRESIDMHGNPHPAPFQHFQPLADHHHQQQPQPQQPFPPQHEPMLQQPQQLPIGPPPLVETSSYGYPQQSSPWTMSPTTGVQHPALLQFYEAQMRDHAAAYASAAAGAAWAAAQIAADMASASSVTATHTNNLNVPRMLPVPPPPHPHNAFHAMPAMQPSYAPPPQQQQQPPPQPQPPAQPFPPPPPYYDSSVPMYIAAPQAQAQPPAAAAPEFVPQQYYYEGTQHYANLNNNSSTNLHNSAALSSLTMAGDSEDSHFEYGHHRRKRQQRMPPSSSQPRQQQQQQQSSSSSKNNQQHQRPPTSPGNAEKRSRRRRRFKIDASSESDSQHHNKSSDDNLGGNSNSTSNNINSKLASSSGNNNGSNSSSASNTNLNRRRVRKMALASSGSEGGGSHAVLKKKQRQPNDESLLGKTGVSALYEWCGKRRTTPTFALKNDEDEGKRRKLNVEDFEMIVSIDGVELGYGRGRTKSAAKQEAARRALLVILPGVIFDDATGIVVELPPSARSNQWSHQGGFGSATATATAAPSNPNASAAAAAAAASTSLEDLAPNLAKRLAIGHGDDEDDDTGDDEDVKSHNDNRDNKPRYKLPHVYPGTSTTSDDEDENAYYASRGASVCSALLHAMVQIDDRIPEPPVYTYQVSTVPNRSNSQLKRKAGGPFAVSTPIVIHRGSFTCTATMRLRTSKEEADSPAIEILQANGVGGTKREARHTASAKLLALLFPECDGMVHVKQAAEAARERYAASKALKQQTKRERASSEAKAHGGGDLAFIKSDRSTTPSLSFATASEDGPRLPIEIKEQLLAAIGAFHQTKSRAALKTEHDFEDDDDPFAEDDDNDHDDGMRDEAGLARQLSRQEQLDERITVALQKLNERDEEGRTLPDELTADDVGRTVLRKATHEDSHWIEKLINNNNTTDSGESLSSLCPLSVTVNPGLRSKDGEDLDGDGGGIEHTAFPDDNDDHNNKEDDNDDADDADADGRNRAEFAPHVSTRLWSSSTIVLLLCRAIAPYEDPPLGCAALTLGFSMEKGRILRVAQIASKSHLPKERFIECLESFASCMNCSLITGTASFSSSLTGKKKTKRLSGTNNGTNKKGPPIAILEQKLLTYDDIEEILESHIGSYENDYDANIISNDDNDIVQSVHSTTKEENHDDADGTGNGSTGSTGSSRNTKKEKQENEINSNDKDKSEEQEEEGEPRLGGSPSSSSPLLLQCVKEESEFESDLSYVEPLAMTTTTTAAAAVAKKTTTTAKTSTTTTNLTSEKEDQKDEEETPPQQQEQEQGEENHQQHDTKSQDKPSKRSRVE